MGPVFIGGGQGAFVKVRIKESSEMLTSLRSVPFLTLSTLLLAHRSASLGGLSRFSLRLGQSKGEAALVTSSSRGGALKCACVLY